MKIRVYYEDTDAGGIVYHSNYLNYCERARSEYFFAKGMLPIINGSHFVVRKMDCDFLSSTKFGDVVEVYTSIIQVKNSSFSIFHEIKIDNKILFTATVILVLVKDGKVQRLTPSIKDTLNSLFNWFYVTLASLSVKAKSTSQPFFSKVSFASSIVRPVVTKSSIKITFIFSFPL